MQTCLKLICLELSRLLLLLLQLLLLLLLVVVVHPATTTAISSSSSMEVMLGTILMLIGTVVCREDGERKGEGERVGERE